MDDWPGALLVVDPEEDLFEQEAAKLVRDVGEAGLGLLVVADWHNASVMDSIKSHLPSSL